MRSVAPTRAGIEISQNSWVSVSWKPAAGSEATAAASGGQCLQLKATDSIAPKAKIIRERAKLEAAIVLPFGFTFASPAELKA